jgi:hypothetical protein
VWSHVSLYAPLTAQPRTITLAPFSTSSTLASSRADAGPSPCRLIALNPVPFVPVYRLGLIPSDRMASSKSGSHSA